MYFICILYQAEVASNSILCCLAAYIMQSQELRSSWEGARRNRRKLTEFGRLRHTIKVSKAFQPQKLTPKVPATKVLQGSCTHDIEQHRPKVLHRWSERNRPKVPWYCKGVHRNRRKLIAVPLSHNIKHTDQRYWYKGARRNSFNVLQCFFTFLFSAYIDILLLRKVCSKLWLN